MKAKGAVVIAADDLGPPLEVMRILEGSLWTILRGPTQIYSIAPFYAPQIAMLTPAQIAARLTLYVRAGLYPPDEQPAVYARGTIIIQTDKGPQEATLYELKLNGRCHTRFSISSTHVRLMD